MKKTILLLSLVSSITATLAHAENFQLQNVRVGGLGCPPESTQVMISTDNETASILFSQFESKVPVISTSPKVQRDISTLNCNIFVDVKLPLGMKMDSLNVDVDMRGFTFLDKKVTGSFKSYLVSKSGLGTESRNQIPELIHNKTWGATADAQEEDFSIRISKAMTLPSNCSNGGSTDVITLRLQNTLSSQILAGAGAQAQGSITMDSSDISGGFKISAKTSACRPTVVVPGKPGSNCREERVNGRVVVVCR